ncbi:MAG: lipoate--protein ligase family protein [Candidatus Brocadiia bacterium]
MSGSDPVKLVNPPVDSPAEHLACDEALLLLAEAGKVGECLRIYEFPTPTVVMGIQDHYRQAARVRECRQDAIPLLRRRSGGGTVLLAPGCLTYSAVLRKDKKRMRSVRQSYHRILNPIANALNSHNTAVELKGISDLSWGNRKVGGSAQQRKSNHILHHGTLLYDLDPRLLTRYLGKHARPPEYRRGRSHREFVTNLPLNQNELTEALLRAFNAENTPASYPAETLERRINTLTETRYSNDEWIQRR